MFSLIVYERGDKLAYIPGDYRGLNTDGVHRLCCISTHENAEDAKRAYDAAMAARDDA